MTRSSPGVLRVAAILNFMADHPGQAFGLTDLVRALKLSRATCHALLAGLVDVGYLYRASDKTYVLGPKLAAIGRTAAEHFSPLQVAQPEMRKLADDFDVVCAAYFLESDILHLRDRAASISHVSYPVPMGTKMPLRSAQAVAFYAWSPKEAEAWLKRASPKPGPAQTEHMFNSMAFAREIGFVPLIRRPGAVLSALDVVDLAMPETDDLPVVALTELDSEKTYSIGAIMGPVFVAKGKVSFCLVMAGFQSAMSGAQIMEAGNRLRDACARISTFVSDRSAEER